MKTAELEGVELNYWVARANGDKDITLLLGCSFDGGVPGNATSAPAYSTDWAHGGPIIEKHGIDVSVSLYNSQSEKIPLEWSSRIAFWVNIDEDDEEEKFVFTYGKTPLISAMRAFVASKFGDEVTLSKESAHTPE